MAHDPECHEQRELDLASFPEKNPNPVVEIDLEGQVTYANPAALAIFPDLPAAGPAHPFLQGIGPISAHLRDGGAIERDQHCSDAVYRQAIHRVPGSQVLRLYSVDVTERKRAEDALCDANERLAIQAAALHAANAQLQDQAEALQSANEELQAQSEEMQAQTEELAAQAGDLQHANEELQRSEALYRSIARNVPRGGVLVVDQDLRYLVVDGDLLGKLGIQREGMEGRSTGHLLGQNSPVVERFRRALAGETTQWEGEFRGHSIWASFAPLRDAAGRVLAGMALVLDVSERRQADMEREMTVQFLRLANESRSARDLIESAARFVQAQSGCEAVGLRLREGDDFPYFEARGFPQEFVEAENFLCARDASGEPQRDAFGNPVLDCMCGNILQGRFDPSKPFFSPGGSFWTNSTTDLLASTTAADRMARTRNRCNGEGYESVALIPLRVGEQCLGLLQLNDRQPGRFTPEGIALWERLAGHLAVALAKLRAEDALRESESRYRYLFENMLEGFAFCRMLFDGDQPVDFIYLDVNWAFAELTGLRDVVGRRVTDVVPGIRESNPEVFEVYGRVTRTGVPAHLDTYVEPLGIWFSISVYSPVPEHFVAVFENVTERKQAEEALRAAEMQHRVALEAADLGTWRHNMATDTVHLDQRARQHLGSEAASMPVAVLMARVHPEDLPIVAPQIAGHLDPATSTGRLFIQPRIVDPDGSVRWLAIRASALFDGEGAERRLAAVIGTTRDVTERRRMEEAQARLAAILEATTDLVATFDPRGGILTINPAGRRMLGLGEPEDVVGLPGSRFCTPEAWDLLSNEGFETATRDGIWTGETALVTLDGRQIPVAQMMLAHKKPDGSLAFLSTMARDISERKLLEEELRQAQKMEAVGRLAGGVAHDFNNLLTPIIAYSQFLCEALDTADVLHHYAVEIASAAERAAGLPRQLLAFSRKQVIQPRVLDLNEIVSEMERMLRRLIGEDILLSVVPGVGLGKVKADPGQIEQVLMNLAVNARDAMPVGGRLTIETVNAEVGEAYTARRPGVRPGRYVVLLVSDTGFGMDQETLARIFEPFFTTKDVDKGTGLGLSTVYGIVKQSGGEIHVYSEPGKGTTFRVYLPRVDLAADHPAEGAAPAGMPWGSETVLLVEDEENVRAATRAVLAMRGYAVLAAENAEAGLAASRAYPGPIHLLLTDVVMPGMSGPQLAEALAGERPEMRVLFMSGYTDAAIVRHGVLPAGMAFLQKPFPPGVLLRMMRDVLSRTEPA